MEEKTFSQSSSSEVDNSDEDVNYEPSIVTESSSEECDYLEQPSTSSSSSKQKRTNKPLQTATVADMHKEVGVLTLGNKGHTDSVPLGGIQNETAGPLGPPQIALNEIHDNVLKRGRKRERKPETWRKNVKKMKVNTGKAYFTSTNKEIPERVVQGTCSEKCKLRCSTKISNTKQVEINKCFYQLGDRDLQRSFIVGNTSKVNSKYRERKQDSGRGNNIAYYFTISEEKVRVCKQFFMKTISVGDKMIRNCWKKVNDCGVIEKDRRGKHTKHKVSDAMKDEVRQHIGKFPKVESHYLRAQTKKEYLDGSLTIAEMYRMYVEEQKSKSLSCVKHKMYADIFNNEFNLSFFQPKKDQCALCEKYKNSSQDEKESIQESYERHCLNKELSRAEKKNDVQTAKEKQIIVSCYDLQAVLQVPCGEISTFYYKRKLNCFNFTIFDVAAKVGFCYFWNESLANRGVNEIASCVYMYLNEHCQGKPAIMYSDNAAGQNKNKAMASMYMHTVMELNIPYITHKYLIVGHTQNEGDSMHATIERQRNRALKCGPIYTPSQWTPVLQMAKKDGNPYSIKEVCTEDIKNYKGLPKQLGSNFEINELNERVVWSDIKVLEVRKDSPSLIFYKTDYREQEFKIINVRRRQRGGRPSQVVLQAAYEHPPHLAEAKVKDLRDLCTSGLIPKIHHPFFFNLNSKQNLRPTDPGSSMDESE